MYKENQIARNLFISYYSEAHAPYLYQNVTHRHTACELMVMLNSRCTVHTDGVTCRGTGNFVVYYPSMQLHQQINDPTSLTGYTRYCINFDACILRALVPTDMIPKAFFLLPLEPNEVEWIRPYLEMMLSPGDTQEHFITSCHLFAIILHKLMPLVRERVENRYWKYSSGDQQVYDICRYIQDHIGETLTLEDIAARFYMSRSKLVRIFRSRLNTSVYEYILNVRINKAKQLLLGGLSVGETAALCGFATAEYFIRVFRRQTGMTPAKFRKENRISN